MFYEILGSYIDLSAVTTIKDELDTGLYGNYNIFLTFESVADPYVLKANKYQPWDMAHARQALAQIRRELEARGPAQCTSQAKPWPFQLLQHEIDLYQVRAVERVERIVSTDYSSRNNRRPVSDVVFQFRVIVAGMAPLHLKSPPGPDIRQSPMQTTHEKLLKQWMTAMGWQDAA